MGFVVDLGGRLYHMLFKVQTLPVQIAGAAIGCFLLYMGVAMYITADVGLDPFTGFVMTIRDKVNKQFRVVKVCFDICCIVAWICAWRKAWNHYDSDSIGGRTGHSVFS